MCAYVFISPFLVKKTGIRAKSMLIQNIIEIFKEIYKSVFRNEKALAAMLRWAHTTSTTI